MRVADDEAKSTRKQAERFRRFRQAPDAPATRSFLNVVAITSRVLLHNKPAGSCIFIFGRVSERGITDASRAELTFFSEPRRAQKENVSIHAGLITRAEII